METSTEHMNDQLSIKRGWHVVVSKDGNYIAYILSFADPSQYGIHHGRISKLDIRDKNNRGRFLCNYDRGWDVKPIDEVKEFYDEIINKYN